MFDYYGMPSDTPFIDYVDVDLYKQIEYIEQKITDDIGCKNFKFNFVLHEFEGLLFSDVCAFKSHVTWVWDAYRGTIKHLLTTIT